VGPPDRYSYDRFLHTEVIDNFEFNVIRPYKDKIFLHQKYVTEGLTPKEIAKRYFFSRQSVYKYLKLHKIRFRDEDLIARGHIRFGQKKKNGAVVPSKREIKVLEMMRELRGKGFSYEKIATSLNAMKIKTKRGRGKWYAHTVYKILKRSP
jgi:transposase